MMNRDRLHLVRTPMDAAGSHPVQGEVCLEQESLEPLECILKQIGVSFSRVFRVYGITGPRLAGLRDPGPGPGLAKKATFY